MVCPHCNFVMDPLDDECSKCRGTGRRTTDPSITIQVVAPATPSATLPATASPLRPARKPTRSFNLTQLLVASSVMFLVGFGVSRAHYRGRIHELYSRYILQPKNRVQAAPAEKPKLVAAKPKSQSTATAILPAITPATRTLTYVVSAAPRSTTAAATVSYKDPRGKIARAPTDPPLALPWSITYGMNEGASAWLMASGVKGNVSVEVWQDGKLMDSAVSTDQTPSIDCTVKVGQAAQTARAEPTQATPTAAPTR